MTLHWSVSPVLQANKFHFSRDHLGSSYAYSDQHVGITVDEHFIQSERHIIRAAERNHLTYDVSEYQFVTWFGILTLHTRHL